MYPLIILDPSVLQCNSWMLLCDGLEFTHMSHDVVKFMFPQIKVFVVLGFCLGSLSSFSYII